MNRFFILSLAASAFAAPSQKAENLDGTPLGLGVDVIDQCSKDQFQCFIQSGYTLSFIRGYNPTGQGYLDPNASISIHNAYPQMPTEVYMVPQPLSTKFGATQFDEMYNGLRANGIMLRSAWIQVKNPSTWSPNINQNLAFLNGIITRQRFVSHMHPFNDGCTKARCNPKSLGVRPAVLTTSDEWKAITGDWKNTGDDVMLWYQNTQGLGPLGETTTCLCDFTPFGEWDSPTCKKFGEGENLCGVTIGKDSFPLTKTIISAFKEKPFEENGMIPVGFIGF